MNDELTLPKHLIQATLHVVACRTRLILELSCLNENEKKLATDDMIERQMLALQVFHENS